MRFLFFTVTGAMIVWLVLLFVLAARMRLYSYHRDFLLFCVARVMIGLEMSIFLGNFKFPLLGHLAPNLAGVFFLKMTKSAGNFSPKRKRIR